MEKTKYSVGDVVKLKSGGPDMTIHSLYDSLNTDYYCQWFAGKKLEKGRFHEDTLTLVRQSDEG